MSWCVDPDLYPDSETDTEQDQEWLTDNFRVEESENPTEEIFIEQEKDKFYLNNVHLLRCLSSAYCKCKRNNCQLSRITPIDSQVLTVFYNSIPINITLDSGATTSFITEKLCKKLNIKILPNQQLARLGDGCTIIASVGEIDVSLTRQKWSVRFRAIVVKSLNTDIYGGMNFLIDNDISMSSHYIYIFLWRVISAKSHATYLQEVSMLMM